MPAFCYAMPVLLETLLNNSVSPLDDHGAIVRFAAEKTEEVYQFLHELLAPLEHILGTQPYATDY
jgi:hypothetical protein